MAARKPEKLVPSYSVDETKLATIHYVALSIIVGSVWYCYYHSDWLKSVVSYDSSPIDWCERNYDVHEHVTEFWNTVSSFLITLSGYICFMHQLLPQDKTHGLSTLLTYLLIGVIGIGSAYFHGTLSILGQVLDEVSILWLVLYSAILLIPKGKLVLLVEASKFRSVIVAFMVLTTLVSLISPILSHVIVLSLIPIGVYIFVSAYRRSNHELAKQKFTSAVYAFLAAFLSWLLDKFSCSWMQYIEVHTGFHPQFHALWHTFVAVMCYLLCDVCGMFLEENFHLHLKKHEMSKPAILPVKSN
mmetsp:Transcript_11371/g.12922  ORF Transcript_11371/g.12922 Transcript_11371/m.12922 type:complete len:301 (-) Transcript_11371:282-1184(-)